jgi:parvulin-like peptidyl-prolyl isomerase
MIDHRLLAAAVIIVSLAGCATGQTTRAAAPPAAGPAPVADGQPASPPIQKAAHEETKKPVRCLELVNDQFTTPSDAQATVRVRANVNGMPVLDEEVREACYPFLAETMSLAEPERTVRQGEIFQRELQRIIEREIILQDAMSILTKRPKALEKFKEAANKEFEKQMRSMKARYHIKTDEEFKAFMKQQGMTLAGVRRQIERNFMAMEYMRSRIFPMVDRGVGHEEIWDYYQQHPGDFQAQDGVQWQDLFIDARSLPTREAARRLAEEVIARARGGEDFAELQKKYDKGDSSYRGGEGLGRRRGEIKPAEAEPILFKLHDGEIGPLIELANGFHVVRLIKREYAGIKPFDQKTQNEIRKKLQNEIADREYARVMKELKSKAIIEIAPNLP